MNMEWLVERRLARATEVISENLPQFCDYGSEYIRFHKRGGNAVD
jgi:hypothetical protein